MSSKKIASANASSFEKAVADLARRQYIFRLYLTGNTRRSARAIQSVKSICEKYLEGNYDLEVIDLYQYPGVAKFAQIIAAPTLVREMPLPVRRLIGDLTDPDRVLVALDLKPGNAE